MNRTIKTAFMLEVVDVVRRAEAVHFEACERGGKAKLAVGPTGTTSVSRLTMSESPDQRLKENKESFGALLTLC